MNFKTHNDGFVNIDGTHFQGYVDTTYSKLRATFGESMEGDGHKVDAEWAIRFDDGMVATIYNWKNGKNYLGDNGLSVLDIRGWHIGGHSEDVVSRVQQLLSEVTA